MLKIRHLAKLFLKCNIGNGHKAWFWHDSWTPFGSLLSHLGDDGPRSLRIPRDAKVSEAHNGNGWVLASPRSDPALTLHIYLSSIQPLAASTAEDCFDWVIESKPCGGFSSSKTWEVLRPRSLEQSWAKLVWFKGSTPKHAFHMWVSHLDRIPTRSRLASWGLQVPTVCCLCNAAVETRDHIFLHGSFTLVIWDSIMIRLRLPLQRFDNWLSLLAWNKIRNCSSPPTLRLLATQALVYSTWRQRNNLIHNHVVTSPSKIFRDIDRLIINSITARRKMKSFRTLMACWLH